MSVWQAVDNTAIPQWQRRHLQERLRSLQRSSNTATRKLEAREVRHTHAYMHARARYNRSVLVSHHALQAKAQAKALLEKNSVQDVLVSIVHTDSLSVRTRPPVPPPSMHRAVLTSDLLPSDRDEDGESAERRRSSESRHAARSPGAFWEGSVCLSGSQGNGRRWDCDAPPGVGGALSWSMSDWLTSPSHRAHHPSWLLIGPWLCVVTWVGVQGDPPWWPKEQEVAATSLRP